MLSGSNKERVTYDQLTMGQWMAGFCRAMREETDTNSQNLMLDYLIALLDDSNNFSWASAKASQLCFSVAWSRDRLKISLRLIKFIGLGVRMCKTYS